MVACSCRSSAFKLLVSVFKSCTANKATSMSAHSQHKPCGLQLQNMYVLKLPGAMAYICVWQYLQLILT